MGSLTSISGFLDLTTGLLVCAGVFFYFAGTVGLLRFPDAYCRLHALTKADNLGLGFVVAGLVCRAASWNTGLLLVLTWVLSLSASAAVCHLLGQAGLREGVAPLRGEPGRRSDV